MESSSVFEYFKIWQELRESKPPNINVSAVFVDHSQDSSTNLQIELPNKIKYFHSSDDISCKLFQVDSLYFNTKLMIFYEKELANLIADVPSGYNNTVMLYGPEDEDKDWILYGEMYDLGILHQFVKKVLEEIMLEDKIQKMTISCACHVHGIFYDLLNNNRQLKMLKDEQTKSILLGVAVKLESFKEYIKLMRVLNSNLEELVEEIKKHRSFHPNYTLIYEIKCQSRSRTQKTRFVRFGHESNIKNNYRKIENWSIRLNNMLREENFQENSIEKEDCFLKYMYTIIYQSNSRLNIVLALNKKHNKSSQYLNTLQFGSYFFKISPVLTSNLEQSSRLRKEMMSGIENIYQVDMPKLIDDIRQLAKLKELRTKTTNQIYEDIFSTYERVVFKECDSQLFQNKIIRNQQTKNKSLFGTLVKTERGIMQLLEKYQDSPIKHIYILVHLVLEGLSGQTLECELSVLSGIKFRCRHAKVPENTPLDCLSTFDDVRNHTSGLMSLVKRGKIISKESPSQPQSRHQRKPIVKYELNELIEMSFQNNTIAYLGNRDKTLKKKAHRSN